MQQVIVFKLTTVELISSSILVLSMAIILRIFFLEFKQILTLESKLSTDSELITRAKGPISRLQI